MDRLVGHYFIPFLSSYGVDCQHLEIVTADSALQGVCTRKEESLEQHLKKVRPVTNSLCTRKKESLEQHLKKVRLVTNSPNYALRFFQCSYGNDSTSQDDEVCFTSNDKSALEASVKRENSGTPPANSKLEK